MQSIRDFLNPIQVCEPSGVSFSINQEVTTNSISQSIFARKSEEVKTILIVFCAYVMDIK